MDYAEIPSQARIQKTVEALKRNGIEAFVVENAAEAKQKLFSLLPAGASVMTMTSVTLDAIGATHEIMESGKFESVKKKLMAMDRALQGKTMREMGAAPDWAVGSVHAVTEDGHVLIASQSGSQLPAYAYGASHVIWVVGAQKIVSTIEEGLRRMTEHSLPLESERARKAYGVEGSSVNKVLIVNREIAPGRIVMILLKEVLGF